MCHILAMVYDTMYFILKYNYLYTHDTNKTSIEKSHMFCEIDSLN